MQKVLICLIFWTSLCSKLGAQGDIPIPPRPLAYTPVFDYAGMLKPQELNALTHRLETYEDSTTNEITILTYGSIRGAQLEDFSLQLANNWRIGKAGKDNGILLLIVLHDKKIRLELGRGLKDKISDQQATQIIKDYLSPTFAKEKYSEGIHKALDEIILLIQKEPYTFWNTQSNTYRLLTFMIILSSLLIIRWLALDMGLLFSQRVVRILAINALILIIAVFVLEIFYCLKHAPLDIYYPLLLLTLAGLLIYFAQVSTIPDELKLIRGYLSIKEMLTINHNHWVLLAKIFDPQEVRQKYQAFQDKYDKMGKVSTVSNDRSTTALRNEIDHVFRNPNEHFSLEKLNIADLHKELAPYLHRKNWEPFEKSYPVSTVKSAFFWFNHTYQQAFPEKNPNPENPNLYYRSLRDPFYKKLSDLHLKYLYKPIRHSIKKSLAATHKRNKKDALRNLLRDNEFLSNAIREHLGKSDFKWAFLKTFFDEKAVSAKYQQLQTALQEARNQKQNTKKNEALNALKTQIEEVLTNPNLHFSVDDTFFKAFKNYLNPYLNIEYWQEYLNPKVYDSKKVAKLIQDMERDYQEAFKNYELAQSAQSLGVEDYQKLMRFYQVYMPLPDSFEKRLEARQRYGKGQSSQSSGNYHNGSQSSKSSSSSRSNYSSGSNYNDYGGSSGSSGGGSFEGDGGSGDW